MYSMLDGNRMAVERRANHADNRSFYAAASSRTDLTLHSIHFAWKQRSIAAPCLEQAMLFPLICCHRLT